MMRRPKLLTISIACVLSFAKREPAVAGPTGGIWITPDTSVTIGATIWEVVTLPSRAVAISLDFRADTVWMKVSDEPSFRDRRWVPVARQLSWKSFATDGRKSLHVVFADRQGRESVPYHVDFIVDTEAPKLEAVERRDGAIDVTASDAGTGVKEVLFTNVKGRFTEPPIAFAPRVAPQLAAGNEPQTIYAKVRDFVGHESVVQRADTSLGRVEEARLDPKKRRTEGFRPSGIGTFDEILPLAPDEP